MGSPKIRAPEPSAEERALQAEQLGMLRSQRDLLSRQLREGQALLPFMLKGLNLRPIFDPTTNEITGYEDITSPEDRAYQAQQKQVQQMYLDRTQKALRGELDIDPALTRDLANQQRTLEASLAQQLGPGALASTAGQQAMAEAGARANEIRTAARRGELTLAEQLGMARQEAAEQQAQNLMARQMSIGGFLGRGDLGLGNVSGGLGGILNRYQQQREMQMRAAAANAQRPGPWSMLGSIAGLGAGGFMSGFGGGAAKSLGGLFGYPGTQNYLNSVAWMG